MEIFHILQKIKDQYTKFTNLEKKNKDSILLLPWVKNKHIHMLTKKK